MAGKFARHLFGEPMLQQFYQDVLPWDSVANSKELCCYLVRLGFIGNQKDYGLIRILSPTDITPSIKLAESYPSNPNVYLALASFVRSAGNRKSINATSVKTIVVDLDSREETGDVDEEGNIITKKKHKHYDSQVAAMQAARTFCINTGLSPTYKVNSGRGIHLYWTFTKPIPAQAYAFISKCFKHLCDAHNFLIDPAIMGDPARIIRCPGSLHQKTKTYASILGSKGPMYDPKAFVLKLNELLIAKDINPNDIAKKKFDENKKLYSDTVDAVMGTNSPLYDGEKCVKECKQLAECGFSPEPAWFHAAIFFNYCNNGKELFHKLSALDTERYDYQTCENKFIQANNQGYKPPTCSTFDSINPSVCKHCKWFNKINSPASLSKLVPSALNNIAEPLIKDTINLVKVPLLDLNNITPIEYIPYVDSGAEGFFQNDMGIYESRIDPDSGKIVTRLISNSKILFKRFNVDQDQGTTKVSYSFDIFIPGKAIPLPAILNGDNHFKKIDMGTWASVSGMSLMPSQLEGFFNFMNSYIAQVRADVNLKLNQRLDNMGWGATADGEPFFVVGNRAILSNGNSIQVDIKGDPSATLLSAYNYKGTLTEWKKVPALYRELNQPFGQFAICLSFAAPFMSILPQECTNCLISFYSTEGGKGKTHLAKACASVWGTPKAGFVQANSSVASKERFMSLIHNLPIFVDEITTLTEEDVRTLIFEFINGAEKNRLTKNTTIRSSGSWSTTCMITSNYSLKDIVNSVFPESNAGVLRLLEYECDFSLPQAVSPLTVAKVFDILDDNYGVAGPIFIHQMLNNPHISDLLKSQLMTWVGKIGFNREERFYSYAIGLALLVGRLCVSLGILDYNMDNLEQWATNSLIAHIRGDNLTYVFDYASVIEPLITNAARDALWVAEPQRRDGRCPCEVNSTLPDGYIIKPPTNYANFYSRLILSTGTLIITKAAVTTYCKKRSLSKKAFVKNLHAEYRVTEHRLSLGAGTNYQTISTPCFAIKLPDYSTKKQKVQDIAEKLKLTVLPTPVVTA